MLSDDRAQVWIGARWLLVLCVSPILATTSAVAFEIESGRGDSGSIGMIFSGVSPSGELDPLFDWTGIGLTSEDDADVARHGVSVVSMGESTAVVRTPEVAVLIDRADGSFQVLDELFDLEAAVDEFEERGATSLVSLHAINLIDEHRPTSWPDFDVVDGTEIKPVSFEEEARAAVQSCIAEGKRRIEVGKMVDLATSETVIEEDRQHGIDAIKMRLLEEGVAIGRVDEEANKFLVQAQEAKEQEKARRVAEEKAKWNIHDPALQDGLRTPVPDPINIGVGMAIGFAAGGLAGAATGGLSAAGEDIAVAAAEAGGKAIHDEASRTSAEIFADFVDDVFCDGSSESRALPQCW